MSDATDAPTQGTPSGSSTPGLSRIAALLVGIGLVPFAGWAATLDDLGAAGWFVPLVIVVAGIAGVVLQRVGVAAGLPLAWLTLALFAALTALISLAAFFIEDTVLRVLVAAVVAAVVASVAAVAIQRAAADLQGDLIVAVGFMIVSVLVTMMLIKVQMSVQSLH